MANHTYIPRASRQSCRGNEDLDLAALARKFTEDHPGWSLHYQPENAPYRQWVATRCVPLTPSEQALRFQAVFARPSLEALEEDVWLECRLQQKHDEGGWE